jgi:hypothetical protein
MAQTKLDGQSNNELWPVISRQITGAMTRSSMPRGALARSGQTQRQRMHRSSELHREDGMNPALPLDTRQARKGRGFDLDAEMTFAACPGAGMAGMEAGLIDDGQTRGVERLPELGLDRMRHGLVHRREGSCRLWRAWAPIRGRAGPSVFSTRAALLSGLERINHGDAPGAGNMISETLERTRR